MARRKRTVKRARPAPSPRGPEAPPTAGPSDPRPRRRSGQPAALVGAVIVIAAGALYLRTAARDIVFGDSPELTGAAITLGVAHPPGYPVWTILGHVFTLLPIGPLPFRVSVFSVVAALVCVAVVYATAWRLTRSTLAAGVSAVVLALVPVVWTWSVLPEVFPLSDALVATLVYLLLRWHLDRRPLFFVGAAFVGGIGMANQQTIALVGPAVLWLMWQHRRLFRDGGPLPRAVLAFAAGLSPYLYLPVAASRQPAWNWGDISSLSDFTGHVLRSAYGTAALVSETRFQGGAIADRVLALGRSFTLAEALLVAIGLVVLFRRDRTWFWFVSIAAAVSGPLFIAYTNTNLSVAILQAVIERFFLLLHVVLAPVAALGVIGVAGAIRVRAPLRRALEVAVAGAAVASAIAVAATQFATIDLSEDRAARTFAEDILSTVRPGAILLAGGDAVVGPIGYLRSIEGARPDLTYIEMPLLRADWYVRQLRREYPQLVLRYERFDGLPGTLRGLIEPNGIERFDIMGSLFDDSLASTYGLYRRGLVEELRPKQTVVDPDAMAVQNDAALGRYRIPSPESVASRPWERLILGDYGFVAYDVGGIYERLKRYGEARQWYARALAIDPDLAEVRSALAGLPP